MKKNWIRCLSYDPFLPKLAFSAGSVLIVFLVNCIAILSFEQYIPMSLFLVAIVIATWFGGPLSGLLATAMGAIIELTLFASTNHVVIPARTEWARLLIYLAEGVTISFVVGNYQRAKSQLAKIDRELAKSLENERQAHAETLRAKEVLMLSQKKLQEQTQVAEEASRVKSLFLANMSHEIRTPLTGILGFTELLKQPDLSETQRSQYVQIIERTGQTLSQIINDILDLSKIEAGKMNAENVTFSLKSLMAELFKLLKVKSQEKVISLQFESDKSTPDEIESDPVRLKQILINLIGNAIKFTDRGGVHVFYFLEDHRLKFQVSDTGIGISDEQRKNIFKNFTQGDNSISRRYAGTGLGLALSSQLAELLGGKLSLIRSEPLIGSTFELDIPYVPGEVLLSRSSREFASEPCSRIIQFPGKKVLIVDDSPDNQFLLGQMLKRLCLPFECAYNGEEAIERLQGQEFDLIIMDMQMPVLDGYMTTKILRQQKKSMPIVALTAHAMKEDRELCLSAGCSDYLTKPLRSEELTRILRKHLGSNENQILRTETDTSDSWNQNHQAPVQSKTVNMQT